MKLFLLLIFTICNASEAFVGKVLDVYSNPIKDVNIEIESLSIGAITDSDGLFLLPSLELEEYILNVSHIAYENRLITIFIPDDNNLIIKLNEKSIDYNPIVVTGTRSERHIKNTPMLTHIISNKDIQNSSYSNVKDMLEMAMPNVQMVASSHGNDRIKFQGLDNKYLTFLIDGDRVSGEFAGNLDFSMLGLSNVDKIEVIEGAMSTLYGSGAIGGVVNIITKKNKNPYWFNSGVKYDDIIGIIPSMNVGFNKGILNYNLNLQYTESDGYDLTFNEPYEYNMTFNEKKSNIINHRLILSPNKKQNITFIYKDYYSKINNYDYWGVDLVLGAPLKKYVDEYSKIKYDFKISNDQFLKISYLEESYYKYNYYPYYYSENEYIYSPAEFLNGALFRKEMNFHYSSNNIKYKRLIGMEFYDENYSSFNIYEPNGDVLQESIFEGQNSIKKDKNSSLYFYEERNLNINNILSLGLRIQNISKNEIVLPSLSYLIKKNNDYNYRISYSSGYRNPSIKERYYFWQDHEGGPAILGNPDLKPTKNNYYSFSIDKRSFVNDFSVDFYRNDITGMISTQYAYNESGENLQLEYRKYDNVIINGFNVNYYRKITDDVKLKFVYNFTDPISDSDEILEGISKHSLRFSFSYMLFNKFNLVANVKYAGKKFIFDQERAAVGDEGIKKLSSYFISDLYLSTYFEKISFKVGFKNIFNYKDSERHFSDILNNYDPGRRAFFEIGINIKGKD